MRLYSLIKVAERNGKLKVPKQGSDLVVTGRQVDLVRQGGTQRRNAGPLAPDDHEAVACQPPFKGDLTVILRALSGKGRQPRARKLPQGSPSRRPRPTPPPETRLGGPTIELLFHPRELSSGASNSKARQSTIQEVRALLGARKAIQQSMIALEMSLRGVLRNFGLKVGAISRGRYDIRVRELVEGNAMLEAATAPMLRSRAARRHELANLEREVRGLAKEDPICRLLMTMPGIGAVVALTFKSAVDDPTRFRSSKRVGPWVGLTPSRHQSGERDVIGGITKAGDVNLLRTLCQAATVMMHRGRASWLRTWAVQVAKRRGAKRAMVALARRIGVVLHGMWQNGCSFRFRP